MGLTRSTVDEGPVEPRGQALTDVLHWTWSWRLQADRLLASTNAQGGGDDDVAKRRSFSAASYDEHMLVVAGWNLARAVRRAEELFPSIRMTDQAKALRLLRNLYEHWDEQRVAFQSDSQPKERSAREFVESFPQGHPWSITYTQDDWLLGGVVSANAILRDLKAVEREALDLERQLRSGAP